MPIAVPLSRMINEMSPEARKQAERWANPVSLVIGCLIVAGPALAVEMEAANQPSPIRYQAAPGQPAVAVTDPGKVVDPVAAQMMAGADL